MKVPANDSNDTPYPPPPLAQLTACAASWTGSAWAEELPVTYPIAEDPEDEYADEAGRLYTSIRFYRAKPLPAV